MIIPGVLYFMPGCKFTDETLPGEVFTLGRRSESMGFVDLWDIDGMYHAITRCTVVEAAPHA